jgi:hypothetical protein
MYLPLSSTTPIFVGGVVRHFVEKSAKGDEGILTVKKEKGVLLGSGLIAGEGIMGVAVAVYTFAAGTKPAGVGVDLGEGAALVAFILLIAFLINRTRGEAIKL